MDASVVYFARLRSGAVIPSKREEDAGYDIYACPEGDFLCIPPMQTSIIPTGIASAFPSGFYFQVQERGSTGSRGIAKRCGVIDSGYRGEWFLTTTNLNPVPLYIANPSMRRHFDQLAQKESFIVHYTDKAIAQAVFLRLPQTEILEISPEELIAIPSQRGDGKLGSSNK